MFERTAHADHQVGEIAANALPALEGLERRRAGVARADLELGAALDPLPDRFHPS
jgi:hypothetical protein